jgi:hypothetical protein
VRRPAAALLGFWGLAVLACGGGGGGGGGGPIGPPPPPPPGITFTPAGAAGTNSISLASGGGSDANSLLLEVRVNSVEDLYGIAFDLRYPNTVLRYETATASYLNEGGNQTSLQLTEPTPGTLVIGYTRLGAVSGASGSGLLLTLRFAAIAAGNGNFTFADNAGYNSRGEPIPGLTWIAGAVQVVR